ncbi:MAG: hypothetical protein HC822_08935 [Oscillochloris sp.]|nr:hypothetical protein [Oscillochloris sp.]
MNNSAAIYVAHADPQAVATALMAYLVARGFHPVELGPGEISGRIMIAQKSRRLFFIVPPNNGWVTIWEDPRYFADRELARELARAFASDAIWIEVSGNGVAWARGHYCGDAILEEMYDEVETTFYGEYGPVHFVFDMETLPEDWIAQRNLPFADEHYESAADGMLPPEIGPLIHLALER